MKDVEVSEKRSLLICCGAFRVKPDAFPNLTPRAMLSRCEWGNDDLYAGGEFTQGSSTSGAAGALFGNTRGRGKSVMLHVSVCLIEEMQAHRMVSALIALILFAVVLEVVQPSCGIPQ